MQIPTFASHYYLPEIGPFRSLSELPEGSRSPVFQDLLLRHKRDPGYRRRYGPDYIDIRRGIESELRELFIERGGIPPRKTPFYMTLGESPWFKELNEGHKELRIPLNDLDPSTTSLTFPDSYVAFTRPEKPYYKKVYFLHEIETLWEKYSLPCDARLVPYESYWKTDFEVYVEIQIWADIKLDKHWIPELQRKNAMA